MPQPADMIGRTLARTYQIERLLGGGGMGAVYAAKHVRTGGTFAVKVLHRETAADAEIYKRFQDEARTVSALRHPHIVQVTDFDADEDGTPFIVMELLEGEDLYQRLCTVGKLPLDQVLDIGRQVGSALHAAHDRGVIHRDIKPQNIYLVRHELADMVTEIAKVVDFGISKIRRAGAQMTRDMTILGTPQFMSPEAALGQNSQLDGRADQWSLGVIMYLALSGRLPFDGENLVGVLYMVVHEQPTPLKELCPDVPEHVLNAISKAMSKKKDERFPRMADFVRAISGHGQTVGGPMRLTSGLQMNSAVMRMPLAVEQVGPVLALPGHAGAPPAPPSAAAPQHALPALPAAAGGSAPLAQDAPTRIPHLAPPIPAGPAFPSTPSAATRIPHLEGRSGGTPTPITSPLQPGGQANVSTQASGAPAPEMVRTIPAISGDMLPMTVPVSQAPAELVATPTSPTTQAPFPEAPTRVTAQPPGEATTSLPKGGATGRPPSGNTPTSISMSSSAFDSLLGDSNKTPVSIQEGEGLIELSEPGGEPKGPSDPTDLQAIPTRVAYNAGASDSAIKATIPITGMVPRVGRDQGAAGASGSAFNATLPLSSLKRSQPGSSVDTAYPSTLSRATGEQAISSGGRAALNAQLQQFRERAFALTGITPREPKRLAIAAGTLGTLVFVVLLLILLGGGSKPADPVGSTTPATSPNPSSDGNGSKPGQPTGDHAENDGQSPTANHANGKPPEAAPGDPSGTGSDPANSGTGKGVDTKKPKPTPPPPTRKPNTTAVTAPKKKPKVF
jgi:tRNA A-37 threonylcarbamoyl transferase component Bud32